jgi:hypothetical protein
LYEAVYISLNRQPGSNISWRRSFIVMNPTVTLLPEPIYNSTPREKKENTSFEG